MKYLFGYAALAAAFSFIDAGVAVTNEDGLNLAASLVFGILGCICITVAAREAKS